jgi:hypothetical protein
MTESPSAEAKSWTQSPGEKIGLCVRVVHANVAIERLRDDSKGD